MPAPDLGTIHQFHGLQPVLPVHDVEATMRYYRDLLGFQIDFLWGDPPAHARVTKGARSYGDPVYSRFTGADASEVRPSGQIRLHVGHDIDGLYHAYRARDVEVLGAPQTEPWGLREFSIRDCNGHVLCFCGFVDERPGPGGPASEIGRS